MSNTSNSINCTNSITRPSDMTERVTDLQLREQTDGYNRKNVLLWFLTVASIVILSVLGGGLLLTICTNPIIFNRILDQFINNIAFIIVSVFAILGIKIPIAKSN